MKRLLITGFAFCASAMMANADLGDTYAQSCRHFAAAGLQPPQTVGLDIVWLSRSPYISDVTERFRNNQCVALTYTCPVGQELIESEIWRLLQENARPGQVWQEYPGDPGQRCWINSNNNMYALYGKNESSGRVCLRIAYKSWIVAHGLLLPPSAPNITLPPVQEGGSNVTFQSLGNDGYVPPVEDNAI